MKYFTGKKQYGGFQQACGKKLSTNCQSWNKWYEILEQVQCKEKIYYRLLIQQEGFEEIEVRNVKNLLFDVEYIFIQSFWFL